MTNTIDKVAAEPAEQEPAGAGYRRNRGARNVNASVQRTIMKSPSAGCPGRPDRALAIRQRADHR